MFLTLEDRPVGHPPEKAGEISADAHDRLETAVETIISGCTRCGKCLQGCSFLQHYGTPHELAERFKAGRLPADVIFSCSLSRLCTAVCPEGLDPARLFWLMRCSVTRQNGVDFRRYRPLLVYERIGLSRPFRFFGIPPGCRTVFFPGCALPGSRPDGFERLVSLLHGMIDNLGVVLSCCTKPSHDLGRIDFFRHSFGRLHQHLRSAGVETVLTACPSCHEVFSRYGRDLRVQTVYEVLGEHWTPDTPVSHSAAVAVHDPCNARFNSAAQKSVRALLEKLNIPHVEMKHSGSRTLCCGEGGSVQAVDKELAGSWGIARRRESNGQRIVTYCAGCTRFLGDRQPVHHIVDLVSSPNRQLNGSSPGARAPFTYLNRLRLVRKLKKLLGRATAPPRA